MERLMNLSLPMEVESLVPHRLPMRLVERLLEIDGQNGIVEALVRADCPLVDENGQLEDVALIELIAQSFAALRGYVDRREGLPVRQGFLVGIKKLVCLHSARVGDCLQIRMQTLAELDGFAVAEGEVWTDKTLIARGEIKIWIN
jgi:predicted hotdog family 3-hydroxylacyl-ACP dehydratase